MDGGETTVAGAREFEFALQFEPGADDLMDVFLRHDSLSLWSSAIFMNHDHMWRLDHAKGTKEALRAFDEVFLDETRCNECFDVTDCDTGRAYHVLDRQETSQTIYTLRREISQCHSLPHFIRNHVQQGTVFESRRTGDTYRWRVLYPGDYPIGDVYDAVESHLRDGVSVSVSHITSAGNWKATERVATEFSPAHWQVLEAAVEHGYYERPREVSVADLASILDEPRSTVQYRLRTAEDRIVSQFVEQTL
ncbi:helix-turn-helix domain-containing protein [Halobacterium salinarum]|uniref:helix-turn-helix domain-containing protein n=1 Tax=Halobacterium salinarum TaxID=2242 RepID=UPI0025563587|nr:helix-turn-helix domain-containing protein [Halobacterium salinarum]MDL0128797.1 helix-turn-helix domain-containing protein [Halobacterium salinarum]MDL0136561.1 helix-turn-helix domain-containing protein [Halobacterium salinarum]MDL0139675.1 helix-turn-helix domain-containing protein [Halobacterium salinarum]